MRWGGYGLMLFIGLLIGRGLSRSGNDDDGHRNPESHAGPRIASSSRHRQTAVGTGVGAEIDGLVRSELGIHEEDFSFKTTTRKLHDQPLSPQRTRALLAYGIQTRDAKQLMEDYQNMEICSQELDAVVRRLTKEDPDAMWKLNCEAKIPVKSWDDLMTYNHALFQTLTQDDASGMINRLKQMEPSRNRLFDTDFFSSYWAKYDPAAAAMGFDQVLQLNPKGDSAFAEQIVNSWNSNDPSALSTHVSQLPQGPTRQMFEKAINKLAK